MSQYVKLRLLPPLQFLLLQFLLLLLLQFLLLLVLLLLISFSSSVPTPNIISVK
jgi:hypothetical protein